MKSLLTLATRDIHNGGDGMMTIDLLMLTWTAALCVFLAVPYTLGLIGSLGLTRAAGYPQPDSDEQAPWIQRSKRAHLNMVENIAPFAILVLVAHISGAANETTALAAQVFFWSRVAHAVVHTVAIPFVRTATFAVSLMSMGAILLQII